MSYRAYEVASKGGCGSVTGEAGRLRGAPTTRRSRTSAARYRVTTGYAGGRRLDNVDMLTSKGRRYA